MLFALSDAVTLAIVGVFGTFLTGVFGIIMFVLREYFEKHRRIFEASLADIAKTGKDTHQLANSAMLAQKKMLAEATRTTAVSTGKPEHIALADAAERAYQEHLAGQKVADDKAIAADKIIAAAKRAEESKSG